MRFNIFADLYQFEDSNPSLLARIFDTFFVMCGDWKQREPRLGLYDYLVIPALINYFLYVKFRRSTPLRNTIEVGAFIIRLVFCIPLTLLALPFVLIIHFGLGEHFDNFILDLMGKINPQQIIKERIERVLLNKGDTLELPDSDSLFARSKTIDYLINQLNNNPDIKTLKLGKLGPILGITHNLIKRLTYIEFLDTTHDFMTYELHELALSNMKQVRLNYNSYFEETESLIQFIKLNQNIERLESYGVLRVNNLLSDYKKLMEEEGIIKPCHITSQANSWDFAPTNAVVDKINAAIPMLQTAFEFFKVMPFSEHGLTKDITQYLLLILFQVSYDGIVIQNRKGFARLINPNGLFAKSIAEKNKGDLQEAAVIRDEI